LSGTPQRHFGLQHPRCGVVVCIRSTGRPGAVTVPDDVTAFRQSFDDGSRVACVHDERRRERGLAIIGGEYPASAQVKLVPGGTTSPTLSSGSSSRSMSDAPS